MADEHDNDRPMTEAEWEEHFRESDAQSARFGELFETVMDDPDAEEILAREMGWDEDDEPGDYDPEREAWEQERDQILEEAEASLDDPEERARIEAQMREEHEQLERMPAYRLAFDNGLKVHQAVTRLIKGHIDDDGDPTDEVGEYLVEASANALIPGAKIAGGHGMGYEDDVLCGNIVCCKRALEAAQKCHAALDWLTRQGVLPADEGAQLAADIAAVIHAVEQRIAELRKRVWWQ